MPREDRTSHMNEIKDIARGDRCPGISYTDMLNGDTRRPPDYLFEETTIEMGDEPLSVAPYISEEFAQAEREKIAGILESKAKLKKLIKDELLADAKKFGDARRSPLVSRATTWGASLGVAYRCC